MWEFSKTRKFQCIIIIFHKIKLNYVIKVLKIHIGNPLAMQVYNNYNLNFKFFNFCNTITDNYL